MPPYYSARIRADGNFVSWDEAVQPDPLDYDERWEITQAEYNAIKAGDIPVDPTPEPLPESDPAPEV